MKIAIVHDWLNTKAGGAEAILAQLAGLYPKAPIFTLLHDPSTDFGISPERIYPSGLQKLPGPLRRRPRYLLSLAPLAIEQFDLTSFDVVISSSSAFAKGVITRPETLHVSYCYSPMRYVWDYWPRYLTEQRVGWARRAAVMKITSNLRIWDYYSSARVDRWVAISEHVAKRIQKYYGQRAEVIHASPIKIADYPIKTSKAKSDYYVTLAVLAPYKRIDLAIAAFNQTGRRLVVIGEGSDRRRLEKLAQPNIEFAGRVSQSVKLDYLAGAKALVFPQEEDFGIAPIEAMACGAPVIAYRRGGATETVLDRRTGLFFDQPTPDSLNHAIKELDRLDLDPGDLRRQAERFDLAVWQSRMQEFIKTAYQSHVETD